MNKKQMVLAMLMTGAVSTFASAQSFYPADQKYTSAEKVRVDKTYAPMLDSPCNGIVESSLAIVTMVKMDLPSDEFTRIKDEIDRLSLNGSTPVIRYKAYLAEAVFSNPTMFKEETGRSYANDDALFSALAQRMTTSLLSSR